MGREVGMGGGSGQRYRGGHGKATWKAMGPARMVMVWLDACHVPRQKASFSKMRGKAESGVASGTCVNWVNISALTGSRGDAAFERILEERLPRVTTPTTPSTGSIRGANTWSARGVAGETLGWIAVGLETLWSTVTRRWRSPPLVHTRIDDRQLVNAMRGHHIDRIRTRHHWAHRNR